MLFTTLILATLVAVNTFFAVWMVCRGAPAVGAFSAAAAVFIFCALISLVHE